MTANEALVNQLVKEGWLKTPRLIEAFLKIKREDFVTPEQKDWAYLNEALPLMAGQTISQPLVVAFMLELLAPRPGQKILDIGSGSGWTTALLAYVISQTAKNQSTGKVIALEIIKELKEFGENNVKKYNFISRQIATFLCLDGKNGYPKEAPYDRILVSASSSEIPKPLIEQLKKGGRMVIPIKDSLVKVEKINEDNFRKEEYPGFVFVPLV